MEAMLILLWPLRPRSEQKLESNMGKTSLVARWPLAHSGLLLWQKYLDFGLYYISTLLCIHNILYKYLIYHITIFSSVQLLRLFATPWIAAHQASLSITNSWSSLRLTSIKSVMPSSHLILCRPLLLLPPIPPSIRVFSNESTLRMRWPKYWSFRFSIIPSKEIPGLISFRTDWLDLLAESLGLSRVFSNTTVQKHRFFGTQLSL